MGLLDRLQGLIETARAYKWTSGLLTAVAGLALVSFARTARLLYLRPEKKNNAESTDPGLLRKHTTYESYTTLTATYPRIRTFFHPHPQGTKLPEDLPLIVFVHGLGGSTAQFAPLLTSLVNAAPCLSIDLPGCGLSDFKPGNPEAYTTTAFAELLYAAIERFRIPDQHVIFLGHSMGCSIAALLASSTSSLSNLLCDKGLVAGLIAIAPKSSPPTPGQVRLIRRLRFLPAPLFDLLRLFDRRGGLQSASITRFVGEDADTETRKLQMRFNEQSQSKVFLRFLVALASDDDKGKAIFPGKDVWSGVKLPLFLIAGESDTVNVPAEMTTIAEWLRPKGGQAPTELERVEEAHGRFDARTTPREEDADIAPDQAAPITSGPHSDSIPTAAGDLDAVTNKLVDKDTSPTKSATPSNATVTVTETNAKTTHSFVLKTTVFPAPASHGLLYSTASVRVLSGLIQTFISTHVDPRLSLGWQLQHLSTSGKWDVKNLAKWQKVDPCSEPIADVFRAMKTMREVDPTHRPSEFVKRFGVAPEEDKADRVTMVVDISHESPVYDPKGLEQAGIEYHKFPTVSKLPPTADEVEAFLALIDRLRESPKIEGTGAVIGVHCHYGFNRTGFFIVCYLVERLSFQLQDAIDLFAERRPPGIKHGYFVDELYVRYAVRMERRNTIVG